MEDIYLIMTALGEVKITRRMNEDEIHQKIMDTFDDFGLKYHHEYQLIPHKRFDFWLDGIVIEVKKEKPSKIILLNQLNRYTKVNEVTAIIVVLEKSIDLPRVLNDKPIFNISLNANWGVAI